MPEEVLFETEETQSRSDIADYYFEVQRWDREVGEALKLLEERRFGPRCCPDQPR